MRAVGVHAQFARRRDGEAHAGAPAQTGLLGLRALGVDVLNAGGKKLIQAVRGDPAQAFQLFADNSRFQLQLAGA